MGWKRKVLIGVVVVPIVGLAATALVLHESRPVAQPSEAADAMARAAQTAARTDAWEQTRALKWTFGGKHRHVWDRDAQLARVEWDNHRVKLDLADQTRSRAWTDGKASENAEELIEDAYAKWINDSFWLNPIAKVFDPGTSRAVVTRNGKKQLLVSYASGGVTPGDAYLWEFGDDGMPVAWRMWVSIFPIGGLTVSWGGWKTLDTGAIVSTHHELDPITFELTDVAGARSLEELGQTI